MVLNNSKLSYGLRPLLSICLYLLVFFVVQPSLVAQDIESSDFKEFKGLVVDGKSKNPLEYASISVSNSNISTISNLDGVFLLKVPATLLSEQVTITYLGYKNQTVPLSYFTDGPNGNWFGRVF